MLREDGCGASETAQLSALTVALNAAGRHAEAAAAAACPPPSAWSPAAEDLERE